MTSEQIRTGQITAFQDHLRRNTKRTFQVKFLPDNMVSIRSIGTFQCGNEAIGEAVLFYTYRQIQDAGITLKALRAFISKSESQISIF